MPCPSGTLPDGPWPRAAARVAPFVSRRKPVAASDEKYPTRCS